MNVTIRKCEVNPFIAYPDFKNIWPDISSKNAQEYTAQSLGEQQPGLFLIFLDETPVGMTGFFDLEYPDNIYWGLRWHGVLPAYRSMGISDKALYLTAQALHEHVPEASYLVEYIPHTDYSAYIFKYFTKLGFEPLSEPESVDWAPHQIQAHGVLISDLIKQGIQKNVLPKPNLINRILHR